ncbi:hypothetical protein K7432_007001, partial [Basidiobolus ranarum]
MKATVLSCLIVISYSLSANAQQDRWPQRTDPNDEGWLLPNRFRKRPSANEPDSSGRFRPSFFNRRPDNVRFRDPQQFEAPEDFGRTQPFRDEFENRSPPEDARRGDFDDPEVLRSDRNNRFTESNNFDREQPSPNSAEFRPPSEQPNFDFGSQPGQTNSGDFRPQQEQPNSDFRPQSGWTNPGDSRLQPEQV